MNIVWMNPDSVYEYEGKPCSRRPCVRLRCIEPATHLRSKGHNVKLVNLLRVKDWLYDPGFYSADMYVIGKALMDVSPIIKHLKQLGKKIIVDICDNVFEPPEDGLKKVYKSIFPLADIVISASKELANYLMGRIEKKIVVIPDHVEGAKLCPSFNPSNNQLRLLWFGWPNNLCLLDDHLPNFSKIPNRKNIFLSIVTVWNDYWLNIFRDGRNGIHIKPIEWSLEKMRQELINCDMVVIPSSFTPARITKTANRVMTSLYAGKYVCAYPLPSYLEFSPFISLGEDLTEGIQFGLNNPEIVRQRILNGQLYIEKQYSSKVISQRWESVFHSIWQFGGQHT